MLYGGRAFDRGAFKALASVDSRCAVEELSPRAASGARAGAWLAKRKHEAEEAAT
jgi:hypothetical protein